MKMGKAIKFGTISVICAIFLTGCVPNIGGGGAAPVVDEYQKGAIVTGFPALPYYENAKVIESYGDEVNFGATLVTDDELAKVVNFYQDALETQGWDVSVSGAGTNFEFDIKNADKTGSIIINTAADNRRTAITVAISPR